MHDIVIRGGTIVDGTGAKSFSGDVAIDGDRIALVGGKAGPGKREINADGQLVTPGWVDIHTHYDGQATWDPVLAPSSWHGVTTILMGNCGVGFAPVRKADHDSLIDLMEGVEDIPGIALAEGLKWDWESFPDYLNALERMPRTIDVAPRCHTIRFGVLRHGRPRHPPGNRHRDRHRGDGNLTEEALRAGAFGFTTSRTEQHKTTRGELVPGRFAENEELFGIGARAGPHRRRRLRHADAIRGRGRRVRLDEPAGQDDRPAGMVPADRPFVRSGALWPADGWRAPSAGGRRVGDGSGRGPAGRHHPGSDHIAESVRGEAGFRGADRPVGQGPPGQAARSALRAEILSQQPSEDLLAVSAAVAAPDSDTLGSAIRSGRSAGLRARSEQEHRRDGRRSQSDAGGVLLRLPDRRERRPHAVLPGDQLRARRPSAWCTTCISRPGHHPRARRWRRTLRSDLRLQPAVLHADPLGARPPPRPPLPARIRGQAPDQRNRRLLRLPRPRPAGGRQEGRHQRHRSE